MQKLNVASYLSCKKQNASVGVKFQSNIIHIVLVQFYIEPGNDFNMQLV